MRDQSTIIERLIQAAYSGFNTRNINSVLSLVHPDIHWPKAFEGGYVNGRKEVETYWTRQWSEINPIVKTLAIKELEDGRVEVLVYQLVKDLEGNVIFDDNVKHIYEIRDELLFKMVIED
ncbi:nuclear transport factor 2 family protein [Mucilaginibacter aquatilis]|uniref:Ketosteroid isomerase n=1 Tax=Mucilaginibacter aquatilis TaxID=1517760 RepID=A0A6I4I840_9SPHI|nr:nuclear transport factor 2 family protein [Mucilaginibacter aquatilis]MVN91370.1 ketosteroid isomerase [Mucilaginibacter aquatilis]